MGVEQGTASRWCELLVESVGIQLVVRFVFVSLQKADAQLAQVQILVVLCSGHFINSLSYMQLEETTKYRVLE